MIAPNEDVTAAGSGETAPTTPTAPDAPATPTPSTAPEISQPPTAPEAPTKPRWAPAVYMSGEPISPARYAERFGDTAEGLVQWAESNQTHLGIPGEYNAAVLLQAAGRLTELTLALGMIKAVRPALLAVYNGESLHNEAVREAFRHAMNVIEEETAGVPELPVPDETEATVASLQPTSDESIIEGGLKELADSQTATPATPAA